VDLSETSVTAAGAPPSEAGEPCADGTGRRPCHAGTPSGPKPSSDQSGKPGEEPNASPSGASGSPTASPSGSTSGPRGSLGCGASRAGAQPSVGGMSCQGGSCPSGPPSAGAAGT